MLSLTRRAAFGLTVLAGAYGVYVLSNRRRLSRASEAAYANPLPSPEGPLSVYHLGHSLVGRDMPAMLAQLAGPDHSYDSQLGWGTSLKQHWEPDEEINGFDVENDHPRFRAAKDAIAGGGYDAIVLTEMVEIADAIRYHDSADYLATWASFAHQANPDARMYLYETWHHTDDGNGWLYRIDRDLEKYWQGRVMSPALVKSGVPIHLIPAGQAKAAFARALEDRGGVGGLKDISGLFSLRKDGSRDTIHFNDIGAYFVALVHYSVLYQRSPVGLRHALNRADGSVADAPSEDAARLMQETVWDTVRRYPETGLGA